MRAQPGLTVVAPADPAQARTAARATSGLERPIYYRIGKGGEALTGLGGRFRLGRAECLGGGDDVAIVAMGSMAVPAAHAAAQLAQRGLGATVAVVSSFGPAPREDLAELIADIPLALTAEAAYVDGGVGSLVAEIIAEEGLGCRLVRCGVREMPRGLTGSPAWLLRHHGLDPESLANAALTALRLTGP
jgi:transketolase